MITGEQVSEAIKAVNLRDGRPTHNKSWEEWCERIAQKLNESAKS